MSKRIKIPKAVTSIKEHVADEKPAGVRSISYSQLSSYSKCNLKWYLKYVENLEPSTASIHTVFGTAIHETIQEWLDLMYNVSVKASEEYDFEQKLQSNLWKEYASSVKKQNRHFSKSEELYEFYQQGVKILNYLRKKRTQYFTTKKVYLVGVEIPLVLPLENSVYFKGYIDIVFYDERVDEYLIVDIKTSTSGWNSYKKKDKLTTDQLVLYKNFFAQQFNIDESKVKVLYLIVKRIIPDNPEFPTMSRRVQEFVPVTGPRVTKQSLERVNTFVQNAFRDGKAIEERPKPNPSKNNCRFCYFKEKKDICSFGIS